MNRLKRIRKIVKYDVQYDLLLGEVSSDVSSNNNFKLKLMTVLTKKDWKKRESLVMPLLFVLGSGIFFSLSSITLMQALTSAEMMLGIIPISSPVWVLVGILSGFLTLGFSFPFIALLVNLFSKTAFLPSKIFMKEKASDTTSLEQLIEEVDMFCLVDWRNNYHRAWDRKFLIEDLEKFINNMEEEELEDFIVKSHEYGELKQEFKKAQEMLLKVKDENNFLKVDARDILENLKSQLQPYELLKEKFTKQFIEIVSERATEEEVKATTENLIKQERIATEKREREENEREKLLMYVSEKKQHMSQ